MRSTSPCRAALAAVLLLPMAASLAPNAHAADSEGRFAVKSVGGAKCSTFVEAMKSKDNSQIALYVIWVAGYISAANQLEQDTFDLMSWQDMRTLTALLARHCDRNADMRFGTATAQMAGALKVDRLRASSEMVKMEHEGKTIQVYSEALRRAQAALAELGLFSGDLDGKYGDGTREALLRFQEQAELPATGVPNQQTLFKLFAAVRKPQG